uniref:RING-type E3 ubiquitin transferase n=1 Tax=Panagrellus redivivus TaxID=6233 RepID=A0A7E4ZVG4_PANRE
MSDMPEPSLNVICLSDEDEDEVMEVEQRQSDDDDVVEIAAPPGTDSNCVICLEKTPTDPTLLSCCSHYFCYVCISTWIFNNPSCPMCKKPLEYIKHKLRPVPRKLPANFDDFDGEIENVPDKIADYELDLIRSLPDNHDFRYETQYVTENLTRLYANLDRIEHFIETQAFAKRDGMKSKNEIVETISRYSQLKVLLMSKDHPPSRETIYNNPEFRRIIYRFNLGPRNRIAPKFPFDSSPSNVEQHLKTVRARLIPYLSMELAGILQKTVIDFDRYLNVIMDYLLEKNKNQKTTYTKQLNMMGIANPHHFLSNLTHYLNSGQRLNIYHENTEWRPRGEIGFRHLFTDNSDVQVISEMAPPPQAAPSMYDRVVHRSRYPPNDDALRTFMDHIMNRDQPPVPPVNNETVIDLSDDDDSSGDADTEDNVQMFAHPACRFNQPLAPPTSSSSRNRPLQHRSSSIATPNLLALQRRNRGFLRDMPSNLYARELLRNRRSQPPSPEGARYSPFDTFQTPFADIDFGHRATSSSTRGLSRLPTRFPTPPLIDVDESDEQPGPSARTSEPGPSSSSLAFNARHPRIRYPASESDSDVQIIQPKRSRN